VCDVHISTNGGIAIGESRSSSSKPLGLPAPSDSLPPLPYRFPSPSATSLFFFFFFMINIYTPPTALAATSAATAATPTACRPLDSWRADLLTGAAFQKDSTRRCHQRHYMGHTRGASSILLSDRIIDKMRTAGHSFSFDPTQPVRRLAAAATFCWNLPANSPNYS
jgi:hypothetical protein